MLEPILRLTECFQEPDPAARRSRWQEALEAYLIHALNSAEIVSGNPEKELL